MTIKLNMYENEASKPAFDALAAHVLDGLDLGACHRTADMPLFGQYCGIEYVKAKADPNHSGFHYLAHFSVADPEVPAGHYQSFIITHKNAEIKTIADLNPEHHNIGVNYYGSFSGDLTFSAHLKAANRLFPKSTHVMTGGHLGSIQAVMSGKADCAAIDALSFALQSNAFPDIENTIQIIDKTTPYPGLPLICDPALPDPIKAEMRARLLSFTSQPAWQDLAQLLDLRDITVLEESAFDKIAAREQQSGWPEGA